MRGGVFCSLSLAVMFNSCSLLYVAVVLAIRCVVLVWSKSYLVEESSYYLLT